MNYHSKIPTESESNKSDSLFRQISLGGNEFLMDKFIFSQAVGVYLRKPTRDTENIYHRWGLYYRAFNNGLVCVNLKAHRHESKLPFHWLFYKWI